MSTNRTMYLHTMPLPHGNFARVTNPMTQVSSATSLPARACPLYNEVASDTDYSKNGGDLDNKPQLLLSREYVDDVRYAMKEATGYCRNG